MLFAQGFFTVGLGDFRIHRSRLDSLALFLFLNGISRISLCLLDIRLPLEFGLADGQLILPLGNLQFGLDLGIVGFLHGLGLLHRHIPVSQRLGNRSILADTGRIVRAQIRDQPRFIGDILDIAGNHLDAQTFHILSSGGFNLFGEGITIRADFLQRQRTDNLTHITFEGIAQLIGDEFRRQIQEVLGRQQTGFFRIIHRNLCHGIYLDIDEIIGRHALLRADIDRHLPEIQAVNTFQQRHLHAALPDQHPGLGPPAGEDKRHIGRCLHPTGKSNCHDDK